jgi:hypothetical protein
MKNFLFADETEFWLRLINSFQFVDELQFLDNPQCIAEPEDFWPPMYINEKP